MLSDEGSVVVRSPGSFPRPQGLGPKKLAFKVESEIVVKLDPDMAFALGAYIGANYTDNTAIQRLGRELLNAVGD